MPAPDTANRPLRVLFVSHSHPKPGGALENMGGMQRVSMQLWYELQHAPEFEVEGLILEADWKQIGRKTAGFLASLVRRLPEACERFKPDVVLFSSMVTASTLLLLRKKIGVPAVAINHGQDVTLPNPVYQALLKRIFARLDGTISVSAATREQTVSRGMPPNRAFIIHNGFYPEKQAGPDCFEARRRLYAALKRDWNVETPLLLSVGRQVKRKGHVWFLEQVLPLIQTPVNVLLIGEGPESPRVRELSAGRTDVFWAGRRSDDILRNAYHAADLFLMPNIPVPGDMEGFGIVLVEANAAGVPVLASRLEGMIDVIEDGENGLLIEPLNAGAFASSVDAMLKEDLPALRARARAHATERFSWPKIIRVYRDVLGGIVRSGLRST